MPTTSALTFHTLRIISGTVNQFVKQEVSRASREGSPRPVRCASDGCIHTKRIYGMDLQGNLLLFLLLLLSPHTHNTFLISYPFFFLDTSPHANENEPKVAEICNFINLLDEKINNNNYNKEKRKNNKGGKEK